MAAPDYRKRPPEPPPTSDVTDARATLRKLMPDLPDGPASKKAEAAASVAIDVMYDLVRYGEPREQAEASRVLLAAHVAYLKGPPAEATTGSVEAQREQMRRLLAHPPPELAALLAERDAALAKEPERRDK